MWCHWSVLFAFIFVLNLGQTDAQDIFNNVTVFTKYVFLLNSGGRLVTSFFGYPDTCVFRGSVHACTLSLACWLVGGRLESGCGTGDFIAEWLFTCCIPANQRVQRRPPIRRGDAEIDKSVRADKHVGKYCGHYQWWFSGRRKTLLRLILNNESRYVSPSALQWCTSIRGNTCVPSTASLLSLFSVKP